MRNQQFNNELTSKANVEGVFPKAYEVNRVIKNTYILLAMTLVFSAVTAYVAIVTNAASMHWLLWLVITVGLLFATSAAQDSVFALPLVFLFTGFLGYATGPTINFYLHLPDGAQVVATGTALTALIFLSLSAYAFYTKKDFSFLGGFLFAGIVVVIVASMVGILFPVPKAHLGITSVAILVFSGYILYDTSEIIHGGESNFVAATVSLYLDIALLFPRLLHLIEVFTRDQRR